MIITFYNRYSFAVCAIFKDFNEIIPKEKDDSIINVLSEAEKVGKSVAKNRGSTSIHFPYVSPDPVCEYTERYLFEKAFPWLFPGGIGGYHNVLNPKPTLQDWIKKLFCMKTGGLQKIKSGVSSFQSTPVVIPIRRIQ